MMTTSHAIREKLPAPIARTGIPPAIERRVAKPRTRISPAMPAIHPQETRPAFAAILATCGWNELIQ